MTSLASCLVLEGNGVKKRKVKITSGVRNLVNLEVTGTIALPPCWGVEEKGGGGCGL